MEVNKFGSSSDESCIIKAKRDRNDGNESEKKEADNIHGEEREAEDEGKNKPGSS